MNRNPLKMLAMLLLVGLFAAACGDDASSDDAASAGDAATAETVTSDAGHAPSSGVDSPAAQLRAALTALLQEHVYLAGITTGEALAGHDITAPAAALEANTQALQDAVASVYGDAGGQQFGDLWRKHIAFFVDYTTGRATQDQAKVDQARADLDGYRADFGAFLESATDGGLPKQAVADELKPHVESLFAAIDAQAAADPAAFDLLRAAAGHMPMTAAILAGAIVTQFPEEFDG